MQTAGDPIRSASKAGRVLALLALLVVLGVIVALCALKAGYPALSWQELFRIVYAHGGSVLERISVLEIRLPRIILGALAGAMLGISGVLLQSGLRNPLASPELIGVSAGSSLMAAAITVLHLPIAFGLRPLLGLLGGLAGGGIVLAALRGRYESATIILMGTAVTAMLNGLVVWLVTMGTQNDVNLLYTYLLGSLAGRSWQHVAHLLPWAVVALPASFLFAGPLNLLRLGDERAEALGQHVVRVRLLMLVASVVLVAAVVAQCGPIGYIALLGPHITRAVLQTTDARLIVPFSAAVGAVLLISADLLAKIAFMPQEVPVGLWTTMLGVPVLLVLFIALRREKRHEQP